MFDMFGPKMRKQKVEIEGRDPPGEIHAEIMRNMAPEMRNNYNMTTRLLTKMFDLGSLGFRAQLAHPWG